jgi:hypothetical protein
LLRRRRCGGVWRHAPSKLHTAPRRLRTEVPDFHHAQVRRKELKKFQEEEERFAKLNR